MAASLRSLPPVPAAFRRSRASSSPSSSSSSAPKARFVARRSESVSVQQLSRPLALAEYVSLPTSQCSVHKGGLVCPVPLRPWRGEGSRGRRRYAGRRATGRAEEPMSAPAAAPAAQPTGASPGKAVVPDDEFSLAKVSFGVIGLGVGISLLSYGFGSYFNLLPGSEWSALLLTYGFPLTIIGMALKYAELKPVPCTTYADAFALREKCATPILKQKSVRDEEDVLRAIQIVHTMIDREVAAGTNPEDVFVFGLSQGGALSIASVLTYPRTLGGCAVFSCFLPFNSSSFAARVTDDAKKTPVLWIHGEADSLIPIQEGRDGVKFLRGLGMACEFKVMR